MFLIDGGSDGTVGNLVSGCPPTGGKSFAPSPGSFSTFTGLNSLGNWRLAIQDTFAQDTGQLQAWTLYINCPAAGAATPTPAPSTATPTSTTTPTPTPTTTPVPTPGPTPVPTSTPTPTPTSTPGPAGPTPDPEPRMVTRPIIPDAQLLENDAP